MKQGRPVPQLPNPDGTGVQRSRRTCSNIARNDYTVHSPRYTSVCCSVINLLINRDQISMPKGGVT